MVSQKQLIANSENAKKGGPSTKEGKAVVRWNAVKHGLLCQDLVLPGEKKSLLNKYRKWLITYLHPIVPLEMILVERMVSCHWRLARAIRLETDFIGEYKTGQGANIVHQEFGWERSWLNLNRYETSIERQFYRPYTNSRGYRWRGRVAYRRHQLL